MVRKEKSADMIRSLSGLVSYQGLVLGISDEFQGLFVRSDQEDRFFDFSELDFQMDYKERKKVKDDHESVSLVSNDGQDFLFSFPSMSKPNRIELGIFEIDGGKANFNIKQQRRFRLSNLYSQLEGHLENLNIEGHFFASDSLFLLNRGNSQQQNEIIQINQAKSWMKQSISLLSDENFKYQIHRKSVFLGNEQGFELQWTDGFKLSDSSFIFLATVEKTDNAFDDGEVLASYIGLFDLLKNQVVTFKRFLDSKKAEGICLWNGGYLVCIDSDSPKMGNEFYSFPTTILD